MLGAAFGAGSSHADVGHGAILDRIEPGLWSLRMRGSSAGERICVADGRRLIQLRHPQANCRQLVVNDDLDEITVQYSCPGRGYGRTHLRLESHSLVQVESQGVAGKQPFEFVAEARRVGSCAG